MHKVHWNHYPLVASTPLAREWLEIQAKIGLAPNTVEAYGRGLNDFLAFSQQYPTPFAEASKVQIPPMLQISDKDHTRKRPIFVICILASAWPGPLSINV